MIFHPDKSCFIEKILIIMDSQYVSSLQQYIHSSRLKHSLLHSEWQYFHYRFEVKIPPLFARFKWDPTPRNSESKSHEPQAILQRTQKTMINLSCDTQNSTWSLFWVNWSSVTALTGHHHTFPIECEQSWKPHERKKAPEIAIVRAPV